MAKKAVSRKDVVELAVSWLGFKKSDRTHEIIIDIFNKAKTFKSKMTYDMAWCAATGSALHIALGSEKIFPVEMSCGRMIDKAISMDCWEENDAYIPLPGDGVLYDWDDTGKGDNKGWPEHYGTVISVDHKKRKFRVMEGNASSMCKVRVMDFNGQYIRGFVVPKYEDNTLPGPEKKNIKTTVKPKYKDVELSGIYKTTAKINCRNGAGQESPVIISVPKGTKIQCYGFYNTNSKGGKWLHVQFELDNVNYVGYCSATNLKKVI